MDFAALRLFDGYVIRFKRHTEGLVERYASTTGRDPGDMTFYLTFARFKVAVIIQQIYYRYAQGLTQDARFAAMPERIHTLLRAAWHCAESRAL